MSLEREGQTIREVRNYVLHEVEILETDQDVVIIADLPPFEVAERIRVSLNGEGMTLSATLDMGKGSSPQYRDCVFGAFSKLFRLRDGSSVPTLPVQVEDGLLRISIPKRIL